MRRPVPRAHLSDRTRMWHAAAAVLAVAAGITVLEAAAKPADERVATLASGVFPLVGSVVAWIFGPRLRPRVSYLVGRAFLVLAVVSAALAMHTWANTVLAGAMAFHFVLAIVFAAAFFHRRDVVHLLGLIAALQVVVLTSDGVVSVVDGLTFVLTMLTVAGSGLVLSSAVQAMDTLSYRDGLTGAANRRAWDLAIEELLAPGRVRREPVSVLLVDIDHFKAINDTAGHDGGDAVLRAAVTTWRQVTRADDTFARLGGDEFGLLLPGCHHHDARQVAEQLLRDLRRLVGPTCSIGVATLEPGAEPGLLLATADAQLYRAKDAGRACVRGAVVEGGTPPDAEPRPLDTLRRRRVGSTSGRPVAGAS